ncbi:MAG TPA: amino acid ABC transporter substrate-binding protein [Actinomycetota bacterium]|nr:amino acid ABC transporter substrate-binding protein [Actinomycetota bacterium]
MRSRWMRVVAVLAVVALVGIACDRETEPVTTDTETGENGDAAAQGGGLLQEIVDRGTLNCGVNETVPGFGFDPGGGEIDGFDIDFCRAFAAAIIGDPEAIELIPVDADNRFIALQNGEYDVLVRNTTWTASRDGTEGIFFAHPNFYDGQAMMVRAGEFSSIDEMDGANICVTSGTTTELNLADYFQQRDLDFTPVTFAENPQLQRAFIRERCDGWTSDRSQLAGIRSAWPDNAGGPESLEILDDVMSKEPLAPGVLDSEVPLGDAINMVVNGLILAEELGVTQQNVEDLAADPQGNGPIASLLGAPVPDPAGGEAAPVDFGLGLDLDFMVRAISAVGNYGEIFARHLGPNTELGLERGINALWTDGGIQYAIPLR